MIRRFLRARDLDIEKASTLFVKYLTWKRNVMPKGHIPETEIANDLSHKKVCMQGHDKTGRPIVVVIGNRHNPSKGNPEEFKRQSPLFAFIHNLSSFSNKKKKKEKTFLQWFFGAGFVAYTLEKVCARLVSLLFIS